jgi:hypothetical protein
MHICADIALARQVRRARVQADPDTDPSPRHRLGRRVCGRERAPRGRERIEERVTLRVDLDAAMPGERVTQYAPMLGQRPRVRLRTELVQQPRRAFEVCEEERDCARRKLACHMPMIAGRRERFEPATF